MPVHDEEIRVVRSAFDIEIEKWEELASRASALGRTVNGLSLHPLAFFCGNPQTAEGLSKEYGHVYELVKTLMADAEAEFFELANALRTAKDLYDGSDRSSASTFVSIYGERQ